MREVGNIGSVQYCSPPAPIDRISPDQYQHVLFGSDYWSLMVTFYVATYGVRLFHKIRIALRNKYDPNYLKIIAGQPPTYSDTKHGMIDEILRNEVFRNCTGTGEARIIITNMRLCDYFVRVLHFISMFDFSNTMESVDKCDLLFKKLQYCITDAE